MLSATLTTKLSLNTAKPQIDPAPTIDPSTYAAIMASREPLALESLVTTDALRLLATKAEATEPTPEPTPEPIPLPEGTIMPVPSSEPTPEPIPLPERTIMPVPSSELVPELPEPDTSRIVVTDEDQAAALWKAKEPEAIAKNGFVAYLPEKTQASTDKAITPTRVELVPGLISTQIFDTLASHICKAADAFELLETAATLAESIATWTVKDRTLQVRADVAWQAAIALRTKIGGEHGPDDALYADEADRVVELVKQIHFLSTLEAAQHGSLDVAKVNDEFWWVLQSIRSSETCKHTLRKKKRFPWWMVAAVAAGGIGLVLWSEKK
jgi:hypothetical protein